ncbi:uncharacterized protein KGF55_001483 [Candida pseudojiufengensis]|uniref:uncharacterized protein n=1 Tax=Candida pseudojiufengensis TaxID=497109 RepID=UPI0022249C9C|nr:uncharacterized protein KGF55_001483 [Candida pseudojiufengensis]KAI5965263.1 hypothetical protein KGF55_001483 [Candida pseudojiufengensis]
MNTSNTQYKINHRLIDVFKSGKIFNQTIGFFLHDDDFSSPGLFFEIVITITQKYDKSTFSDIDRNDKILLPENPNLILYLQGGPGFGCSIPTEYSGMTKILLDEGYQIVWMDQRGTGLSEAFEYSTFENYEISSIGEQFNHLLKYRADYIVQDAERIRQYLIGDNKWTLLGQSFGGFCCFSYLSKFSNSIKQVLVTGGIPPIGFSVDEVYTQTYKRTKERNLHYYEKYPIDVKRVVEICSYLKENKVLTPNGGNLTVERFQQLGLNFGGFGGTDKIHSIVTKFYLEVKQKAKPSYATLSLIQESLSFDTNVLYALLQEAIYCENGMSSQWSADRLRYAKGNEKFIYNKEQIFFTGEMVYKSMFDDYSELRKFKELAYELHEYKNWTNLYDIKKLKSITFGEIPIVAATYYSDQYVDFSLTQQVKEKYIAPGNLRQFITNELFHGGLRTDPDKVLGSLFKLLDGDID